MNESPVFLAGLHKSGTSLLRSIFDGHSHLYTLPIETHYFQNMKYWVDNEYRRQRPEQMTSDQVITRFTNWIHTCNTSRDPMGDSMAAGIFNEELFRESFSELPPGCSDSIRIKKYFEAILISIAGTLPPANVRFVEKSVENAEFAIELKTIFPKAKFIHIIRNPYANLVALRKYKSRDYGYPVMMRLIRTMYNGFYFLYKNKRIIDNYYVLKYEDLVSSPESEIKKICDFLGIPWEDKLLTPTFLSRPWSGNSTSGQKYDKISSSNLDKWKQDIHPMEMFYINKQFSFVLKDYDYEKLGDGSGFWWPVRGENLKRYAANRMYRYFMGKDEWNS